MEKLGAMMDDEIFETWSSDDLSGIGLIRRKGAIEIDIPQDANNFDMMVGAQIKAGRASAPAMIFETADGTIERWNFGEIDTQATALAADLRRLGYGRGDLIGLHTGMRPETAIAHMAVCKLGATAVTLSQLYGPDTLAHALNHCQARCLLSTEAAWAPLRDDAAHLFPYLRDILVSDTKGSEPDLVDILRAPVLAEFIPEYTGADDAALLMYTSGSTGMPKGILHGHRVLASYRPSISRSFNLSMHDEDAVFWSPSDWAWVGGLLDMLFPAWLAGRPVVTSEARFKAAWAYDFIARHKVTQTFLAPRRPGSMWIAYPGHDVRLVDDAGNDVAVGEQGEIVTPATAPTRYMGYLKNADKDAELRLGDLMRTSDLAVRDADGYFWYKGSSDDLIKSSDFRIGPAEIEECLLAHAAVAEVGVVGKPDADRGNIVKAFIRLAVGTVGDEALSVELIAHVRERLAPY